PATTGLKCSRTRAASRLSVPRRLSMSSPDRLGYMANQIGTFFRSQGHDKAVPGIADHIKKFWDPRMKRAIFAHLDAGGAGLEPNVREALTSLKQSLPAAP